MISRGRALPALLLLAGCGGADDAVPVRPVGEDAALGKAEAMLAERPAPAASPAPTPPAAQ